MDAKEVRDLLVECFCDAHCKALEESAERKLTEQEKKAEIIKMVKNSFKTTGGNYDKPNKESLKKAIEKLKQTAKYFRDDATIEKNYNKMLGYIKKIR